MSGDKIIEGLKDAVAMARLEKVKRALGLTRETDQAHARHNLMGARIDLERLRSDQMTMRERATLENCLGTIRRIEGQIREIEIIMLEEKSAK